VIRHVAFLSTLYLAWGAVFAVVALAGFALAGGAAAIASSSAPLASTVGAKLTAATLAMLASIALAWAALHLWAGSALQRHRPSARLLVLALAVGNLVLVPFGTALGGYACWVLLNDEGRKIFEG
jgi:hypothetical protein